MSQALYCPACLHTFRDDGGRCANLGCGRDRPEGGWGRLLGPGDVLDRHYSVQKVLAFAGAGVTYLARELDPFDQPIEPDLAIKVLYAHRDRGSFLRRLANEAQILQSLAHEHIVECRGFVQRRGMQPYLVTTFESGGTLDEHIRAVGPLPAWVAARVMQQVLGALEVAHRRGVVHRDLKPQNVLLRERVPAGIPPRIRVADFGIAKVSGTMGEGMTRVGSFVGTPEYAAPEQFLGEQPTPAADVFAAGVLLHTLVTGRTPVRFSRRSDIPQCHEELLASLPTSLDRDVLSHVGMPEVQAILRRALTPTAKGRWTVREFLAALDRIPESGGAPTRRLVSEPLRPALTYVADDLLENEPPADDVPGPPPPPPPREPAARPAVDLPRTRTRFTPAESAGQQWPSTTFSGAGPVTPPELAPNIPLPQRELTLEDLFGSAEVGPQATVPVQTDDTDVVAAFDPPTRRLPPAQASAGLAGAGAPGASAPAESGVELPPELPRDIGALLALLGTVVPSAQGDVVDVLRKADSFALGKVVRDHALGGPPDVGAGIARLFEATGRTDQASRVQRFLGDPSPRVRAAMASALGGLGRVGAISALGRLLSDDHASVRYAGVRAVAEIGRRVGRPDLARSALTSLQDDPDRDVRGAARRAISRL